MCADEPTRTPPGGEADSGGFDSTMTDDTTPGSAGSDVSTSNYARLRFGLAIAAVGVMVVGLAGGLGMSVVAFPLALEVLMSLVLTLLGTVLMTVGGILVYFRDAGTEDQFTSDSQEVAD